MQRPTRYDCLMETARIWAKRGTCPRAEVGAVIEKNGRIISIGYVGAPMGSLHCSDLGCLIYSESEGCVRGIHAEINAIGFAARNGIPTEGSTLHVTVSPCLRCSQAIIAAGIIKVVYDEEYRDLRGIEYLKQNGVYVGQYQIERW
ncbi:MAG: dCMP deaminase family protein [Roseiflexus sp.]|uniref:deoxycytidylate deaminase n=1 Tax=Roseiflexus sp. TaxID=2562120 RepID=UPI0025FFD04B|nr:dCMP deaminase family protein [Roseiflexus sp.]MCL6542080.1 dCMP deaminase family protein [Roseiflexus sp.]